MNELVNYLNTLHGYNAQNSGDFAEKSITSPFFNQLLVDIPISDYIYDNIKTKGPHTLILTGHAGDGKTSIMHQVLSKFGFKFDVSKQQQEFTLDDGKQIICIKDYSEISPTNKQKIMDLVLSAQKEGKYSFVIANTGPLIKYFSKHFEEQNQLNAQSKFIDLIEKNDGEIADIFGYKICAINVVALNNTFFASEYVDKIVSNDSWGKCETCSKKNSCPIYMNISLCKDNLQSVKEFLKYHYIWLLENGNRLTIRSMTEQLSYMFTGGLSCEDATQNEKYKYLLSNLFFGYNGILKDDRASSIISINETQKCNYDHKRLRIDENLFINKDYTIFPISIKKIIEDIEYDLKKLPGWEEFIRRLYFFFGFKDDEKSRTEYFEDVFSKQFLRFTKIKYDGEKPSSKDNNLIQDALTMLYIGKLTNNKYLPITLNRENDLMQNVRYCIATIKKNDILFVALESNQKSFLKNHTYKSIGIKYNRKLLKMEISLPLLNYFEDLRNGVINTNIDPQLSKGVETLKSEILKYTDYEDNDNDITMIVNRQRDYDELRIVFEDDEFSI